MKESELSGILERCDKADIPALVAEVSRLYQRIENMQNTTEQQITDYWQQLWEEASDKVIKQAREIEKLGKEVARLQAKERELRGYLDFGPQD